MPFLNGFWKTIKQIFNQKKLIKYIYMALVPAVLFYILSLHILASYGFTAKQVVRDPAQITKTPSLYGFLSIISGWLWVSSIAVCFFALLSKKRSWKSNLNSLLFLSGSFSLVLAVDDVFMLHDRYINSWACYGAYAFFAVMLLLRHLRLILWVEGFGFLAAGLFLSLSILVDVYQFILPYEYDTIQPIEEGFKFFGIVSWLYFNVRMALLKTNGSEPAVTNVYQKAKVEVSVLSQ